MTFESQPLDTARLRKLRGPLGSNPGGVFQDERGRCFYIKTPESPAHARNELMAARLYRLVGAPTLTYISTTAANEVATEWVELDKKYISSFSESERRQAQHWYAVHAWTANWDAAGFLGDNQGVVNGTVVTLDLGGALLFRGQGDPKGRAFGTRVNELSTLRSNSDNPYAVQLFGDMSDEDIRQAILVVVQTPGDQIRKVISDGGGHPALADKLIARQADMAQQLTR